MIRVFDIADRKWVRMIECDPTPTKTFPSYAFSADGKLAVVSSGKQYHGDTARRLDPHHLCLWDLERGVKLRNFDIDKEYVRQVAISPDGKRALSDSIHLCETIVRPPQWPNKYYITNHYFAIRLWDTATGKVIRTLYDHGTAYPRCPFAFSRDGKICAAIYTIGCVLGFEEEKSDAAWHLKIWSADNGKPIKSIPLLSYRASYSDNPVAIAISPDAKHVAIARRMTADLWEIKTGKKKWEYSSEPKAGFNSDWRINSMTFSKDGGNIVLSVARDWASGPGAVHVLNVKDGTHVPDFKTSQDGTRSVSMTPDGRSLIGTAAYQLRLWDIRDGTFINVDH